MKDQALNGVSTFLWDTTYTTTYDVINRKILESAKFVEDFECTLNNTETTDIIKNILASNQEIIADSEFENVLKSLNEDQEIIKLWGKWGKWQLELEGNGNGIFVKLPIISGGMKLVTQEGYEHSIRKEGLNNSSITATVKLKIENPSEDNAQILLADNEKSPVVIAASSVPNISKTDIWQYLIKGAFEAFLNTKNVLDQFRYIFSIVHINKVATGDFAWLKPSDVGYAVFVPEFSPVPEESYFSILCMTEGKKAPSFIQQSVDATVFSGATKDANAVLCISAQQFCKNFLLSATKKIIKDTVDSDYSCSTDGTELHNKNQIIFKNVEINEGKIVDLIIDPLNYSLNLTNDHVDLKITNAHFSETMYTAYITLTQRIEFETKTVEGKTYFTLKEGEEFKGTIHSTIEPSQTAEILKWVGVAIDILGGLLFLAGGAIKIAAKVTTTVTKATATVTNIATTAAETAAATSAAAEAISVGSKITKSLMISNRLWIGASLCGLIGLPFSLSEVIAVAIAKKDFKNIPTLNDFAAKFLSEITWTGVEKTSLLGARLNDCFLLDFKIE